MPDFVFIALVALILIIVLPVSLRIANEDERFAVFAMGRFQEFKGPGLILLAPYAQRIVKLKIGDIGTVSGAGFAEFRGVAIPVTNTGSMKTGQPVRIDGFDGVEPRLAESTMRPPTICPNCGHNF